MRGVIFLVFAAVISSVEACKRNEKLFRCGSKRQISEKLCSGAKLRSCAQYTLHCACNGNMHRSNQGACVPQDKCDKSKEIIEQETRRRIEQTEETFSSALKVLQSFDHLYLLKISAESWVTTYCVCMKSTFEARFINSSIRTVDCYFRPKRIAGPEIMMKESQRIEFYVKVIEGLTVVELQPMAGGEVAFNLETIYPVLHAEDTCILLKTGENRNGKPYCMLWGLNNEEKKCERGCFLKLERECVKDLIHAWEYSDSCLKHDELVEDARKRIVEGEA